MKKIVNNFNAKGSFLIIGIVGILTIIFGIYALGLGRYNLNFADVIKNFVAMFNDEILDPNFKNVVFRLGCQE